MFPTYCVTEEEPRVNPALREGVPRLVELSALIKLVQAVQKGEASEDALREQARFARSAIKAPRARTELLTSKRRKVDRTSPLKLPHDGSDDEQLEVVDHVHLQEGSIGERGPDTAALTTWEAIQGLEGALDGLDRRQSRTDSEVASLGVDAAPKGYVRDAVRTGVAEVAHPLLD